MLDAAAHRIVGRRSPNKAAVLSIDVEHDYNGDRTDALDRLSDLLSAMRSAELPLTAFVEGRLCTERPDLCAALVESGADVQLHCHDHRDSGDSAESLGRGVAAYKRFVGVPPRGYRAHTYRLTEALFAALVREGFAWDSSILPGFGLGAHRHPVFRRGVARHRPDYFVIDDSLVEFPVASWRALGVPFTHSYRQLMGGFGLVWLGRSTRAVFRRLMMVLPVIRDKYAENLKEAEARGVERGVAIGEERGVERGVAIGEERGIAIGEERGVAIGEERGVERGVAIGEAKAKSDAKAWYARKQRAEDNDEPFDEPPPWEE